MEAEITHYGIFDMQLCVPMGWADEQVLNFAAEKNPSGTETGWQIRREGDPALDGDPERIPCDDRSGFIHLMVDA